MTNREKFAQAQFLLDKAKVALVQGAVRQAMAFSEAGLALLETKEKVFK